MIKRLLLTASLALCTLPATAQQPEQSETSGGSWYDYFAGYAGAAVDMVLGTGSSSDTKTVEVNQNASEAGNAPSTWDQVVGAMSPQQLQSLAGAAAGLLGGTSSDPTNTVDAAESNSQGPLAAAQGALASLFGGGTEGQNLASVIQAVALLSPEQQTAILNGVTTQIPGLIDKVQKWWSDLSEADRQGYIQQVKDALNYLVGQVAGTQ